MTGMNWLGAEKESARVEVCGVGKNQFAEVHMYVHTYNVLVCMYNYSNVPTCKFYGELRVY